MGSAQLSIDPATEQSGSLAAAYHQDQFGRVSSSLDPFRCQVDQLLGLAGTRTTHHPGGTPQVSQTPAPQSWPVGQDG
jgi:hypothetical protein